MSTDNNDEFLPPDISALSAESDVTSEAGDNRTSEVLEQHRDALMERSGVVMVGETTDVMGRPAVLIGVREQKNMSRLPRDLDGIPVVVQVIGDVEAQ